VRAAVQVVKWMDRAMQKARRPDGSWVPTAHGGQQAGYGAPGAGLAMGTVLLHAALVQDRRSAVACPTGGQLANLWQHDLALDMAIGAGGNSAMPASVQRQFGGGSRQSLTKVG
jgi:hypothetical protein